MRPDNGVHMARFSTRLRGNSADSPTTHTSEIRRRYRADGLACRSMSV
jgi:hypothetical protein